MSRIRTSLELEDWWKSSNDARMARFLISEKIAVDYYYNLWQQETIDEGDCMPTSKQFVKTCWEPRAMAQILKKSWNI